MEFSEKECEFCGKTITVRDERIFCYTDCYLTYIEPLEDIPQDGKGRMTKTSGLGKTRLSAGGMFQQKEMKVCRGH